ncbi:uncharacterized protein LOC129312550 isoform X1 [Prosopis cineraria]|uniref:uncharacterized protein LOC129312550 isoform X1 n=1 Tax=Prosopis cineraria TaxID=364024 RepID=UPI00241002B6|nr:uncharacterized protein LOC129312550 isoform X1 [Prosopis cineraria]XP_054811178.1 uncharacterized protein LOC129312550 isoform X1 [Prosopis cineraria]XP_054811179.1 uncharacterized protein LOC129312550 isoform X1 [Prosopis cineraria]
MSLQNKGFWMVKGDEKEAFDHPSKIEPKRSRHWFVHSAEIDSLPSKKQSTEDTNGKGLSNAFTSWESNSSFHPVPIQFIGRSFGSETRSVNFSEKKTFVVADDFNARTKMIYGEDASFDLSISHSVQDSGTCLGFSGIKKVKVDGVKDRDNAQASEGLNYSGQNVGNLHQAYNREPEARSVSMGQAFDMEGSVTLMGLTCNREEARVRSLDCPPCRVEENAISISDSSNKDDSNVISFRGFQDEEDVIPVNRPAGDYNPLYNQSSVEVSIAADKTEMDVSNSNAVVNYSQVAKLKPEFLSKNRPEYKVTRKEASNSFPSNVRNLISTGMLDGVPVKYISVAREELRGVIKGFGYLCGCQSCDYTKVLNAHEFETHAGCKTKHPNKHIYFENGKTIYQIVQELKSTPESLLVDTIQTVFGSQINQKAFQSWKESFQAATRELQRIYGKEVLNM